MGFNSGFKGLNTTTNAPSLRISLIVVSMDGMKSDLLTELLNNLKYIYYYHYLFTYFLTAIEFSVRASSPYTSTTTIQNKRATVQSSTLSIRSP